MTYLVYSHTDYLDILTVHTDYLKYDNNILLINKNEENLEHIYSKYKKVIFYDDHLPYAGRLLQSIKQVESDYFILIHDMDILLSVDKDKISEIFNFALKNNIDRIDLQHENYPINEESIIIEADTYTKVTPSELDSYEILLIKSSLYNVNPSIWKKEVLLDILERHSNETYRSIENAKVNEYSKNFTYYKLYSRHRLNTGYYNVVPIFVFLHMTHGGGLMPRVNRSEPHINVMYNEILEKYSFTRNIKSSLF
jgi:hypothetical protein